MTGRFMSLRSYLVPLGIAFLAGAWIQLAAQSTPAPPLKIPLAACASSDSTVLLSGGVARSPGHNGSVGKADFALRDKTTNADLWKAQYLGEAMCFGFNAARKVYVIGVHKQHGIGARITDVRYLQESDRKVTASAFDRKELEAFAAVPSPDLRYIAFIAMDNNDTALFVLDTLKDTLKKIGKAPLPPPLTSTERAYVKAHPETLEEGPWEWMGPLRDVPQDDVLHVTYGEDTPFERAHKREGLTVPLGADSK
jgi:hypothetical protein